MKSTSKFCLECGVPEKFKDGRNHKCIYDRPEYLSDQEILKEISDCFFDRDPIIDPYELAIFLRKHLKPKKS